jgi:hypothetical protein
LIYDRVSVIGMVHSDRQKAQDKQPEGGDVSLQKAFLCHGGDDAALVSKFAQELESLDIPVFLDKWDITSGSVVWTTIDRAIDEASKLVIFLSSSTLARPGVQEELDRGYQKAYEKRGEVFIVPVALEPLEDLLPILPLGIRSRQMIRAYSFDFPKTVELIRRAILDEPLDRIATDSPTDFFYRTYRFVNAMVVELGTALPVQDGFGFETLWPEPIQLVRWYSGPSGNPAMVPGANVGYWRFAAGTYMPKHPDTRLCVALSNHSIRRDESFYIAVTTPERECPKPPIKVRLYDQWYQPVRDSVAPHPQTDSGATM